MLEFLIEYHRYIVGLHVLSMGIGLGAATVSDILFFRFLKDLYISHKEHETFSILSNVIWIALIIVVISGLGIYLPKAEIYNDSAKFLLKMTVVVVIILNGTFLSGLVGPKLKHIFPKEVDFTKTSRTFRRLAFMGGGISIISWYTAFILGMTKSPNFTYVEGLMFYLGLILLAVVASQIMEHGFHRKKSK